MSVSRAWTMWLPASVLLAGVLCVPRVQAGPVASFDGQAVAVRADQLDVDLQRGTATLSGNVVLERGDLTISCARVDAKYDNAPNVTWALASGGVRAQVRDVVAHAQEAELLLGKRRLELRGGVRVARGGAWMTAREAAIDLETKRLRLEQVEGALPIPHAASSSSAARGDAGR